MKRLSKNLRRSSKTLEKVVKKLTKFLAGQFFVLLFCWIDDIDSIFHLVKSGSGSGSVSVCAGMYNDKYLVEEFN